MPHVPSVDSGGRSRAVILVSGPITSATRAGSVPPEDDGPERDRPDPLAGLPDAVYRVDSAGRFAYVNPAAEHLLERRAEDLVGQHVGDCFPDTRGSVLEKRFREAFSSGRPQQFEYFYEPQNRWYDVRAFALSPGLAVFLRDIDEHHRSDRALELQMRDLTAVLDSLPAATVLVGEDGRILSINRSWVADGELLRGSGIRPGGVGDDYIDTMSRGLDPADHAQIGAVGELSRLGKGAAFGMDYQYSYPVACPSFLLTLMDVS